MAGVHDGIGQGVDVSLNGKRIVVTGAARGIGAEAAAELRSRGATVVTLDCDDGADLRCDVSDAAQVDAVFDEIGAAGPIDGLLNNAGAARRPQGPRRDRRSTSGTRCSPSTCRARSCARARGTPHARRRQHRQRRLRDGVHRIARVRPLRRVEGCGRVADPGARQRARRRARSGSTASPRASRRHPARRRSAPTTRRAPRSGG